MKFLFVATFISILTASCGVKVDTTEIKEYRVALAGGDIKFIDVIRVLVNDYNERAGVKALEFVESADQANSRIYIVEGLEARDGKVGWGQWFAETERKGLDVPGGNVDKTTRYSLQAEFDADFFRSHQKLEGGVPDIELRKLFAHEIGHGFQMDHHSEESNVMYYDITGEKDFTSYWPRVKSFFSN